MHRMGKFDAQSNLKQMRRDTQDAQALASAASAKFIPSRMYWPPTLRAPALRGAAKQSQIFGSPKQCCWRVCVIDYTPNEMMQRATREGLRSRD